MKQILHIFAKDSRRFWAEILISLALVAAMVRIYPSRWLEPVWAHTGFGFLAFAGGLQTLASFMNILIPLSWWLLITRVIHDERLVGDNQFWLTRPYEWKKLLAAKVLFIAAFIYLPLVIGQWVLLLEAGLDPMHSIPGLVYSLLLITGILILPLIALATVTKNFARMSLALFGVVIYVIGIAWLCSLVQSASIASPFGDRLQVVLLLLFCTVAAVLQYARRMVWLSRGLLIALLVLIAAIAVGSPDQALMNRRYPRPDAGAAAPPQLTYNPDAVLQPTAFAARRDREVGIDIPIHVSGIPEGSIVIPDDVKVVFEAVNGQRWASPWLPVYMDKFYSGDRAARVDFSMPLAVYDSLKSLPLHVEITFALSQAAKGAVASVTLPKGEFTVPDFGTCTPLKGFAYQQDDIGAIYCRSALRQPNLTFVHVYWSYKPCDGSPVEADPGVQGAAWVGSLDRAPADFGIAPVWSSNVGFTNSLNQRDYRALEPRHLCPGTPITFTQYNLTRRTQAGLGIQDFRLPALSKLRVSVSGGE